MALVLGAPCRCGGLEERVGPLVVSLVPSSVTEYVEDYTIIGCKMR